MNPSEIKSQSDSDLQINWPARRTVRLRLEERLRLCATLEPIPEYSEYEQEEIETPSEESLALQASLEKVIGELEDLKVQHSELKKNFEALKAQIEFITSVH